VTRHLNGSRAAPAEPVKRFYMPTYAIHTLGLPMSLSMLVGVAAAS
jgi:hypothetical protein